MHRDTLPGEDGTVLTTWLFPHPQGESQPSPLLRCAAPCSLQCPSMNLQFYTIHFLLQDFVFQLQSFNSSLGISAWRVHRDLTAE